MFAHKVVAVAISALTIVSAGNSTFSIDPASVTLATRAAWCQSETNVCGQVCDASENTCDPSTLDFTCTCSDGTTPDLNEYKLSLPYYICEQAADNCISQNVGSATGQANCTTSIRDNCGTKNATSAAVTTTAASSSSTGTATAASSSGTAASSSSSQAGAMPTGVQQLSNGAVAVAALLALAL